MDKKYARTYAQIDLGAIRHNILEAKRMIHPGTKILAVVKADAYGHGALQVAKELHDMVDAYGVAVIEEAIQLREGGLKDRMILILGHTPSQWNEELVRYDISQTIYNYDDAKELSDVAVALCKKAKIHIKIDTGMSRIGFAPIYENVEEVVKIAALPGIYIEGAFTHFAKADGTTVDGAREPFAKYMQFTKWVEEKGVKIPVKHVCNSAAIIGFSQANLDMVRSGITTYGIYPSHEVPRGIVDLQPALSWKACISHVKEIEPGTEISYGGTYKAKEKRRIATVPVGYADGMKRDLSNKGYVLVNGEKAPITGRICMDQFMIDVTDIEMVEPGTWVTIIGKDGDYEITMDDIGDASHSFSYEFACSITKRVPRRYINAIE